MSLASLWNTTINIGKLILHADNPDNHFTVADIIVSYTLCFGEEFNLIGEYPNLTAYLDRLCEREHCTLIRHA